LFSLLPPGFPAVPRYFIHTCDMDVMQISQGTTQNVPRIDAGLIKHTPCGWRTLRSRARASRVHHTSSPVPVRRPARLDWASSRPHLAVGALALLLAFGSANTWREDLHLARSVPCLAHTARPEPRGSPRRLQAVVRLGIALRGWAELLQNVPRVCYRPGTPSFAVVRPSAPVRAP
jgi:hypothetical protein